MQRNLNNLHTGNSGEEFAALFLQERGYKILHRKFRNRFGEIDIIARDNNTIVFVEVKTRRNYKLGRPEDAVGQKKLKNIIKVANFYTQKYKLSNLKQRIEVLALEIGSDNKYIPTLITVD